MKNIRIVTINGNYNYGNRLQAYALNHFISSENVSVKEMLFDSSKQIIKDFFKILIPYNTDVKRYNNFLKFSIRYIPKCLFNKRKENKIDFYIVGSDQVWNPTFNNFNRYTLLPNIPIEKRISYAASFGINELPKDYIDMFKKELKLFNYISVREEQGKQIIENMIDRNDIEVLIDPTMLLDSKEWDAVSRKPKMIIKNKYILNYFLGNLSEQRKKEIQKIANDNDCEIIDILDPDSEFYICGPSEFLWLEKNAFLICTDSFHSSVFAILFDRPFIIFEREDKIENMNSRINTLINKFKLTNRRYNGYNITKENLEHDYTEAYKILKQERIKSYKYLSKAIGIKKEEYEF